MSVWKFPCYRDSAFQSVARNLPLDELHCDLINELLDHSVEEFGSFELSHHVEITLMNKLPDSTLSYMTKSTIQADVLEGSIDWDKPPPMSVLKDMWDSTLDAAIERTAMKFLKSSTVIHLLTKYQRQKVYYGNLKDCGKAFKMWEVGINTM